MKNPSKNPHDPPIQVSGGAFRYWLKLGFISFGGPAGQIPILAGAPLVESTHGDLKFTAPLTGITAAVVGVVVNLALFFGWHVLWPQASEAAPFAGTFEWFHAFMSVAAFIALWRFKQDVLSIGASAAIGLAYTYLA